MDQKVKQLEPRVKKTRGAKAKMAVATAILATVGALYTGPGAELVRAFGLVLSTFEGANGTVIK